MTTFARNVVKLTFGNVTAQIISLVAVPIITRIYSPAAYGSFAIYLSITMILFSVCTLHFDRVIVLPNNRDDAAILLWLSLLSVTGFSFLVTISVVFINFSAFLPQAWLIKGITDYLWLVPLGVFVQGCSEGMSYWALRNKFFSNMAVSRVTEAISDRGLVLATGYFAHAGTIGLIGGRIVGKFIALSYLVWRTLGYEIKAFWKSLSADKMKCLARQYREFRFFSMLSFLVNMSSRETPLILLALLFPPRVAGFYALATRVVNMPLSLVGDAISKVVLQSATENIEKRAALARDMTMLFGYLIYLSVPPVLILLCYGEELFTLIFGAEWGEAGAYAGILSLSFIAMFLYRPLRPLFEAYQRQKQKLLVNSLLLLSCAGAMIVGAHIGRSAYIALLALTVTTCIVHAVAYFYLFGLVGVTAREVVGIFAGKTAVMTPLFIIALPSTGFLLREHQLLAVILSAVLLTSQGIIMLIFEPKLREKSTPFLPRPFVCHIKSMANIIHSMKMKKNREMIRDTAESFVERIADHSE